MKLFKRNPLKKLEKAYLAKLEEAQFLQRNGKIPEFARASAEADALHKQILEHQEENNQ